MKPADEKRLENLRKRRDWLRARSHGQPGLHYDRAERAALDWAIDLIERLDAEGSLPDLVRCKGGCGALVERDEEPGPDRWVWCDRCAGALV